MALALAVRTVDRQEWLDGAGSALGRLAGWALGRRGTLQRRVKNALHGTWLGHPLHPALTDVPLGAWTAALVLDTVDLARGGDGLARAADAATAVGLAGALGAAATGLNDWQHTDYGARRVGVAHGLLNATAALLQGGSLALRFAGFRRAGRGLGIAGYGVAVTAAYLGGHLVFEERIGVDHTSGQKPPEEFVRVLDGGELEEGASRRVVVEEMPVLLSRLGGRVYAIAETCSHLGGPLAEGARDGASVTCPWHGSRFDLRTGRVLDGPATFPAPCLEVREESGRIEVRRRREGHRR